MDPIRVGHSLRALRLRRRWRQVDLARRVRVSASTISRIERGHLDGVSIGALRRAADALDASLDVRLRWNGEAVDRLLDHAHAELVEAFVVRLRDLGWETAVEASFSIRGERGSIDILAFYRATGVVLAVEVKSVVPDAQAMLVAIDRKARLAPEIAAVRGWTAVAVARLLVIGDSAMTRRRVRALDGTLRSTFPSRGWEVNRWLSRPEGRLAGIIFLPYSHAVHGRTSTTGMYRANPLGRHRIRAG
jgi:transcriptional regulator with XRE-family HTH domain